MALQVLGLSSKRTLDPRRPLNEVGLDSLMAVELRNALAASTGEPLPAALLFDYPSVESLTDCLATRVLNVSTAELRDARRGTTSADESLVELQRMSEAEAESLLIAELERGKTSTDT
jgi:hypothetical protein